MTTPESDIIAQAQRIRPSVQLFPLLKTTLALAAVALLQSLYNLPSDRPMAFIVAGAAAIQLGSFRSRGELLRAGAFAIAAASWYVVSAGHLYTDGQGWLSVWVSAVGVGSFASLCLRSFGGLEDPKPTYALKSAVILPAFAIAASLGMQFSLNLPRETFDLYLYKFDGRLGVQASFWCGQLLQRLPGLKEFESLVYDALGVMPAVVFAVGLRLKRRLPFNPLAAFVWAGLAAYCLYQICPGTAPFAVFQGAYPANPPPSMSLPLHRIEVPGSWRNAMPSMHVTWALLAFACSIALPLWTRWLTGIFVALTCLATLGLGQHYLIDLIVACPFAAAVSAACMSVPARVRERSQAFIIGSLATLAWLLLLRLGWMTVAPPAVAWLAVVATLAGSATLQTRLLIAYQRLVPDAATRDAS